MCVRGVISTACKRCQNQRLKCDRRSAGCSQCKAAGEKCKGYGSTVVFKFATGAGKTDGGKQLKTLARLGRRRVGARRDGSTEPEDRTPLMQEAFMKRREPLQEANTVDDNFFSQHSTLYPSYAQSHVAEMLRWYFRRNDDSGPKFDVAQRHWIEPLWSMAHSNGSLFQCQVLLSFVKKRQLTGTTDTYLSQKGSVILQIQKDVKEHGDMVDPSTILAIAGLAYCEITEGHLAVAMSHLRAAENSKAFSRLSKSHWLLIAWVDLRFALYTKQPPVLRYHVPPDVQDTQLRSMRDPHSYAMASQAASMCPQTPELELGLTSIFDLFVKSYELVHAWPVVGSTEDPPFNHIYDLEYKLRVLHACIHHKLADDTDYTWHRAELVLLAIQLNIFILSRGWAPISKHIRIEICSSMCRLIESIPDMIQTRKSKADLRSMVWILTVLMTCPGDGPFLQTHPVLLETFSSTFATIGTIDLRAFEEMMRDWPPLQGSAETSLEAVWVAVLQHRSGIRRGALSEMPLYKNIAASGQCPNAIMAHKLLWKAAAEKHMPNGIFLGAMEFYNV